MITQVNVHAHKQRNLCTFVDLILNLGPSRWHVRYAWNCQWSSRYFRKKLRHARWYRWGRLGSRSDLLSYISVCFYVMKRHHSSCFKVVILQRLLSGHNFLNVYNMIIIIWCDNENCDENLGEVTVVQVLPWQNVCIWSFLMLLVVYFTIGLCNPRCVSRL